MSNISYPCDISFVGGIFSLKLYHHTIIIDKTVDNPQQQQQLQRLPLFSITMYQPNMLISQSVVDKTTQFSLFNLILKFGVDKNADNQQQNTTNSDEFADIFFSTKQGDLDEYGVPPALFMYKEYITPAQEKNVEVHLGRQIKFSFSHKTFEKCLALMTIFNEFTTLRHSHINNAAVPVRQNSLQHYETCLPIPTSNKINMIQQNLFYANRIELTIADIEFNCNQSLVYDLKFGIRHIQSKLEIFDHPQKLVTTLSANNLTIQTDRLFVLSPTSITMAVSLTQENWKRMPLIVFNTNLECVDLSIGPENITNILNMQNRFLKCWNNYQEQLNAIPLLNDELNQSGAVDSEMSEKILAIESLTQIPTPKCSRSNVQSMDEFYQDDLRYVIDFIF